MEHAYRSRRRAMAGALGGLLILLVLLSFLMFSGRACHACRGMDCPVCACIRQCRKILGHLSRVAPCTLWAALLLSVFAPCRIRTGLCLPAKSLVTAKIRLDD